MERYPRFRKPSIICCLSDCRSEFIPYSSPPIDRGDVADMQRIADPGENGQWMRVRRRSPIAVPPDRDRPDAPVRFA
jgi:hypothetical protein